MCSCSNYGCPDNENGTCWSGGCDEHKMSRWYAESELDCDEGEMNMNECEKYAIIREMAEALEDCISAMKSAQCIIDCEKCASRKTCIRHKAINALKKAKELMEREETFDEVIAEMNWAHDANVSTDAVGIASYASRLKAAHEREVEDVLRERNDFHAALLTICTANTDSRGLREIAVDACNNRGCDK